MGMSLAQVPAAWLAPKVEGELGPGTSQPLFLIVPFLCVCAAAAAAGWVAIGLGLGTGAVVTAVLLAAIGSPLGAYAALDLSEPLQAAALTIALACAVASTHPDNAQRRALVYSALAGVIAGVAVLTKSSLWIAVPFALLPLLGAGSSTRLRERLSMAAVGLAGPVIVWLWFERTRFGSLFASYSGEQFSHPLLDGLWRLLVAPNRGLLLYFPALALSIAAAVLWHRTAAARTRLVVVASVSMFAALLAVAARWWAWHGLWGWGPRLLVPAIPPLAVAAAITTDRWPSLARRGVLLGSVLINVPGLLQNAGPVTVFSSSCDWPVADRSFAQSLATYASHEAPDGTYRVAPDQVLETVPHASPFIVFPWFAAATWTTQNTERAARWLQAPPWIRARPDISCGHAASQDFLRRLMKRPGWPVWGRAFWPDPDAPGFPGVYDEGLLDQVVRAQQLAQPEDALVLARKLAWLAPDSEADAHVLESLRLLRRRADAVDYLTSLSPERRSHPKVNLVLALFERDSGNEHLARNLLGSVASAFPGTPVQQAMIAPLSSWPRDLNSLTSVATDQAGGDAKK
jgi:hypothetical protein